MQVRSPPPNSGKAVPVVCFVFDDLLHDGRPLLGRPYRERRELLDELTPNGRTWQTPPAWYGGGAGVLATGQERGLEGVVGKRLNSTYRPGTRPRDWIKTKNIRMQEVIIGGWTEGQGRGAGTIGALLLGIPDPDGELRYVGQVGAGLTAPVLRDHTGASAGSAKTAHPSPPETASSANTPATATGSRRK